MQIIGEQSKPVNYLPFPYPFFCRRPVCSLWRAWSSEGALVSEQGRLRGIDAWHEGVAGENAGDSVHRAQRILSGRGDVTADAAEGFAPLFAAEHAGDLLLHLHHANVPFGQVVVEGNT